jgi:hypothetical protein
MPATTCASCTDSPVNEEEGLAPTPSRRQLLGAASYWGPLLLGLACTAVLAHDDLKPLGTSVAVGAPLLALLLRALCGPWVVSLVLAAQVLVGVIVVTYWAAITHSSSHAPGGHATMPIGQAALALLAGAVLTSIWLRLPSTRARTPARSALVWLAATAAVTALAAAT